MGGLRNSRAFSRRCVWESAGAACRMPANLQRKNRSMQKHAPPAPASTRPLWVVVLAAGLIVGIAMGLRQVMGLYLPPMTTDLGIGREPFSTAMAVANLIWGIGAVFAGMVADRYGAGRVVVGGTIATIAGFYVMYAARTPFDLMLSGVLFGIGVSGTGLTALVGAAGRAAPPDKRTAAIASLGMASGIGAFVAFPYTHLLMDLVGWQASLLVLAGTMAVVHAARLAAQRQSHGVEPPRRPDAGAGLQGGLHAPELSAARHRLLRVRLPRRLLRHPPAGVRGRQGPRCQRRHVGADDGRPGQPRRHLHRRAVGPVHREAPGPEPHLLRALLRLPGAAVPADHPRDHHRA